jgi:hypothetical protein
MMGGPHLEVPGTVFILLGVTFMDLLPKALELHAEQGPHAVMTTVLVGSTLRWMHSEGSGLESNKRKLLGFTDNRQDAALQAGCDIVERHGHSRIVPGSAAGHGQDATVAWNYVDLRFASPDRALRLGAVVTADDLVVSFRAMLPPPSEG